jgi:hypothetical protein
VLSAHGRAWCHTCECSVTAGWDAACRCIVLGWDNYNGAYLDGLDVAVGSIADADFVLALGTESVCRGGGGGCLSIAGARINYTRPADVWTAEGTVATETKTTGDLGPCKAVLDAAAARGMPPPRAQCLGLEAVVHARICQSDVRAVLQSVTVGNGLSWS